ncbi:MAG: hypothetical protein KTR25_18370 [Myxococcales bacterium]|nr:hypothetical protein [Myxococcales bacterium]
MGDYFSWLMTSSATISLLVGSLSIAELVFWILSISIHEDLRRVPDFYTKEIIL